MENLKKGYLFEGLLVEMLQNTLHFDILRTGKSGDGGIDFVGHWPVSKTHTVPVMGQCKMLSKVVSSAIVREWEGTVTHQTTPRLGLLLSNQALSGPAQTHLLASPAPLVAIRTAEDGMLLSFQVNAIARRDFLSSLVIGQKLTNHSTMTLSMYWNDIKLL